MACDILSAVSLQLFEEQEQQSVATRLQNIGRTPKTEPRANGNPLIRVKVLVVAITQSRKEEHLHARALVAKL